MESIHRSNFQQHLDLWQQQRHPHHYADLQSDLGNTEFHFINILQTAAPRDP